MNWSSFSRHLQRIENELADEIGKLNYLQFNAWQIIKTPFYFHQIISVNHKKKTVPPFYQVRQFSRSLVHLCYYIWFRLRFGLLKKFHKKNSVLIAAFSGDKLAKDDKGYYFNFLVDGFITEGIIKDYLYIEQSLNGEFRRPSPVKPNWKADFFLKAAEGYRIVHRGRFKLAGIIEKLIKVLTPGNIESEVVAADPVTIEKILLNFTAEYETSKLMLKALKPVLIICSEKPGTGLLAAAKVLRIPTLDLQHGIIDPFHPQYIYSKKLLQNKSAMVLPTWIGVFGAYHKKVLLQSGFWKSNEIVELGSYRMQRNREKYGTSAPEAPHNFSILLPTQWTICAQMLDLIAYLSAHLSKLAEIIVKLHPMEYTDNIERYYQLADSNPGIKIIEKETDVYSLIRTSSLMIGFDSAVLLESISLGTPAITIGTRETPQGIHSVFNSNNLEPAIKSVGVNDYKLLIDLVEKSIHDKEFYKKWREDAVTKGEELYKSNYIINCQEFLQQNGILTGQAEVKFA